MKIASFGIFLTILFQCISHWLKNMDDYTAILNDSGHFSIIISSGRIRNYNRLLTVDAVDIALHELLTDAVCMENALVITPAGESDDVGTSPDTLKANSTIEVLAWLEEH